MSPDSFWVQMCAIPAPGKAEDYKDMWDKHRIVLPIFEWNGIAVVPVSIQAYSSYFPPTLPYNQILRIAEPPLLGYPQTYPYPRSK